MKEDLREETKKVIGVVFKILKVVYILFILFCFSVDVGSGFFMLIVTMAYIIPAYIFFKMAKKKMRILKKK